MNETEQFTVPRRLGTIRPKFILSLVGILAFLGIATGYFEISQSHKNVMSLLQNEAETVTAALSISAENSVEAYREFEQYIEIHLFNTVLLLDHLEKEETLSLSRFEELMKESDVAKSFYVTAKGSLQNFAYPQNTIFNYQPEKVSTFIKPIFSGDLSRTSGYVKDWDGKVYFAVAVRSTAQTAWVLFANPTLLLDLRKKVGVGRLIQDIGKHEEIAYIVLQDEVGIISATENVTSMPTLKADSFFQQAISRDTLLTRVTTFDNQEVFEAVKPLTIEDERLGLIRLGLRMDAAKQVMMQTLQRSIAVLFGFIVIGVILFNFWVSNQNYALLSDAYAKIKTYTGNILENMADVVVAVNREGQVTLFNRAAEALFHRNSEEALGKYCYDIIGQQTSMLDDALTTGRVVRDEEITYTLNERPVVLSVTTTLLHNPDGEIDSAVAVIKDLTEKKNYEEKLRRQEKLSAMGELASGVAHEIRNPLNAIGIIAQRFAYEFQPVAKKEEYQDLANSVVSATRQVSSIIERFLAFARPPKLDLQMHELTDVTKAAIMLVESQAREKGVSIRHDGAEKIELSMDIQQIEQVLVNMLQNAIQATPSKGSIMVRLYQLNGEAVVEIADTGTGIPLEHLNRIFDLYFTTKESGTGMGLSISQRIVSEHEGRIDVISKVERGTTFKIFLPIKERTL